MSSSRHARMMRTAISPRLAINTLFKGSLGAEGERVDVCERGALRRFFALARAEGFARRVVDRLAFDIPVGLPLLEERREAFLAFGRAAQPGNRAGGVILHVRNGGP